MIHRAESLGTHLFDKVLRPGDCTSLFVKVPRPGDCKETFSVFESSCHLLLPI